MRISTVALNRPQLKRRSARLPLNALVRLAGQDHQKGAFTLLPARATGLNRHGAAIQVSRELLVGSILSVRHGRGRHRDPRPRCRSNEVRQRPLYVRRGVP
jgi:hypothetical protein